MKVTLAHAKNPDIPGGYWDGKPAEKNTAIEVSTIAEASAVCRAYIDRTGIGGGNWAGGKIYDGKNQIARVSYNGRVWAMDGSEIREFATA